MSSSLQLHGLQHTRQASLSFTISQGLLKLKSVESVMPSNHLVLCHPLLLLPSVFPSFSIFSKESALRIRSTKYWSFSFSISPSNKYSDWFPLGWTGWISLQSKGLSGVFNTTVQKHQCFVAPRQKENDSYKSESRTHVQSSTSHLSQRWKQSRWMGRDLLCDPVAKIPCFQGRGHRFNPWLRN